MKLRRTVDHVCDTLGRDCVSERRACRVLGQSRSTQRRTLHVADDEPRLVKQMTDLATVYGRYGYRRITMMLHEEGWHVNHKRIERLWRREGSGEATKASSTVAQRWVVYVFGRSIGIMYRATTSCSVALMTVAPFEC